MPELLNLANVLPVISFNRVFLFTLLFISNFASAEICSFTISTDAGSNECTANLIAPKVMLTAAHCFPHGYQASRDFFSGQCQDRDGKTIAFDTVSQPAQVKFFAPSMGSNAAEDVTMILFSEAIVPNASERISPYLNLYFEGGALKKSVRCYVAGNRNRKINILPGSSLYLNSESENIQSMTLVANGVSGPSEAIVPGDSGGGLYCSSYAGRAPELIALTSRMLSSGSDRRYTFTLLANSKLAQWVELNR